MASLRPSSGVDPVPPPANSVVSEEAGNPLPNLVLPAGFLDQVVARVTNEISRQLQPLLSGAHTLQPDIPLQTEPARPQHSATDNQSQHLCNPLGQLLPINPQQLSNPLGQLLFPKSTQRFQLLETRFSRWSLPFSPIYQVSKVCSLHCHSHKTHSLLSTYQWMLELPWSLKQRSGSRNTLILDLC